MSNTESTKQFIKEGLLATFMSNIYMCMTLGLLITGLIGHTVGNSMEYIGYIIDITPEGGGFTTIGWVVLLSPLLLVFLLPKIMEKFSAMVTLLVFIIFSILEGLSLSVIFLAYTESSILTTFAVTAGTFLTMGLIGYTTKKDLTKLGSILTMAVVGLIIAMVVNMFLNNAMMDYIISAIGVLVFTGLIAYDTQRLKKIGEGLDGDQEKNNKLAIMGALTLYLDFINLFLFLLRFLGVKK